MLSLRSQNGGSRNASSNGVIIFWVFLQVEYNQNNGYKTLKKR
jgi:hypothetical protein